jgi:hypothetical protein
MRPSCIETSPDEWERLSNGLLKPLLPLVRNDFAVAVERRASGEDCIILPADPLYDLLVQGRFRGILPATAEERRFAALVELAASKGA